MSSNHKDGNTTEEQPKKWSKAFYVILSVSLFLPATKEEDDRKFEDITSLE